VTVACALAGVIWVPIDASSPPDRLHYFFNNCSPDFVVTFGSSDGKYPTITFDKLLSSKSLTKVPKSFDDLSSSGDPAYYLYTSGTTGKPKCVVLSNKATSNVIDSTIDRWGITDRDVFISVTPLHHDMSVFDIFGCLAVGAKLVVPTIDQEKDAISWNQLVDKHGVTLWCSVPAILEMLLACRQNEGLKSLRLIAQGGDYIKPATVSELRTLSPHAHLFSLGGPTETTIWSIWHEICDNDVAVIPYGVPLPANSYFLLNKRGEHCPVGVTGRIYTAGSNLALGYLDNGMLIQTDFVTIEDDAGKEVRAYQTGDFGRYRRDGVIIFESRVEGYIKIRGVRISLPDIENELISHPLVQHVMAVDYGEEKQGNTNIGVLYVPTHGLDLSASELRNYARRYLPASHVPTYFLQVDELPLSQNGKPNRHHGRNLLTNLNNDQSDVSAFFTLNTEETRESKVLNIYLDILNQPRNSMINEKTDFTSFGLRPHHLKIISAQIYEKLSIHISPLQLIHCRNAKDVTTAINTKTYDLN